MKERRGLAGPVLLDPRAQAREQRRVHVGAGAAERRIGLRGERGVTGEIHFVDAGYNIVGMPPSVDLKGWIAPGGDNGDPDEAEQEKRQPREDAEPAAPAHARTGVLSRVRG